jgi:hypothetical protein
MDGRDYYSKDTGQPYTMVSRGAGRCMMQGLDGESVEVSDEELDAGFEKVPGQCTSNGSVLSPGLGEGLVRLEDHGGASKLDVKARAGLVPGVPVDAGLDDGRSRQVSGAGVLSGVCSICGKAVSEQCEHVAGEKPSHRVVRVQRKGGGRWSVVFGDGSWVEVWGEAGGEDPHVTPYGRGRGGVVDEQARIRACAAVRECIRGGGDWFDGGEHGLSLVRAPADSVGSVKRDDGEIVLTDEERERCAGSLRMLAFAKGADTAEEIDAVVAGDVPLCPRGCGGADVERLGQMGKVGGGDPAYKCVRCGCEYLVTVGPRGRGRRTVFLNEPYTFESGQWEPGLLAGTPVKEIKRMDTDVKGPVAGKLIKACQVEGVSPEEDGEGWVVGFEDGSMALVSYEGSRAGGVRLAA